MKTKKMRMLKILAAGMLMSSTIAMAQEHVGNGGGSHFCPGRSFQESYDIYEGRTRYRLKFDETQNDEQQILENALLKIKNYNVTLASEIKGWLEYISSPDHFETDQNINLVPIPDAHILMTDEGCEYKQLANWDSVTNNVFVKPSIYSKMKPFHRAALKLHEAIYKVFRDRKNAQDSDDSRRIVATVMSTHELGNILDKMSVRYDDYNSDVKFDVFSKLAEGIKVETILTHDRETYQLGVFPHLGDLDLSLPNQAVKIKFEYQVSGYEELDQEISNAEKEVISYQSQLQGNLSRKARKEIIIKLSNYEKEIQELKLFRSGWKVNFNSQSKWNSEGKMIDLKNSNSDSISGSYTTYAKDFELSPLISGLYSLFVRYAVKQPLKVSVIAKIFNNQQVIYSEKIIEIPLDAIEVGGFCVGQGVQIVLKQVTQNQK